MLWPCGSAYVDLRSVFSMDGRFLDRPVHPLDLTIGPRVVGLRQPVLYAVGSADAIEEMAHKRGG